MTTPRLTRPPRTLEQAKSDIAVSEAVKSATHAIYCANDALACEQASNRLVALKSALLASEQCTRDLTRAMELMEGEA